MATWNSASYEGRYLSLTISETVDVINNRSTLNWTLSSIGGSVNYYTVDETTVTINGSQVWHKARTDWDSKVFPAAKGSVSGSLQVAHNGDGSKSITVGFSTRVYVYGPQEYGGTMTLTKIDRAAPTVSCSVSNITANGFKISASSNVTADIWEYSTNSGSDYTRFSSTAGTSASTTLSSLSANTSYSVRVRARKKSNQVYGTSSTVSAKTLGGSVLTSAPTITADASTVTFSIGATVYDGAFYNRLQIRNGSTTVVTIDLGRLTAGTSNRSVTLTATQRTTLLNSMKSTKSFTATLALLTYSSSSYTGQIGSTSTKTCTVQTTAANSNPTFPSFSYADTRTDVSDVVGSNQILVQNCSNVNVTCTAGTAKNGASIASYSVSFGNLSKTSSSTSISLGIPTTAGTLTMTVTCTDTRGYSATLTKQVKVLAHEKPKVTRCTLRRKDEVEALIQLSFSGSFTALKPSGDANVNALKFVGFYYKKTTDKEYGSWNSILNQVTVNGTSFSFTSNELLELDANTSYDFHLLVRDKMDIYASTDLYFTIPVGTPIVSLRKRNSQYDFPRVGINNPTPKEALDVLGNVAMNGAYVLGFVKQMNGEGFNTLTKGGIYFYSSSPTSANAPASTSGFLEVLSDGSNVVQRFTALAAGCAVYVRSYTASSRAWTSWTAKS